MTGVNLGPCEGKAVPVSYKTHSVLLTVNLVGDWGKKNGKDTLPCEK